MIYVNRAHTPLHAAVPAVEYCQKFSTGGGRQQAGGIDQLDLSGFDAFAAGFERTYTP